MVWRRGGSLQNIGGVISTLDRMAATVVAYLAWWRDQNRDDDVVGRYWRDSLRSRIVITYNVSSINNININSHAALVAGASSALRNLYYLHV